MLLNREIINCIPVFSLKRQKHSKEKERVLSITQDTFIVQEQSEWGIHDLLHQFSFRAFSVYLKNVCHKRGWKQEERSIHKLWRHFP